MGRALVVSAVWGAGALALAGCGSSTSSANGPRDTELSYFATGSPVVGLIATAQDGTAAKNARAFNAHFPAAGFGRSALGGELAKRANLGQYANLTKEIKPLLGNPLAVGSATASNASRKSFLLAFVATDAGKLANLVRSIPVLQGAGSYDGAKLYQGGPVALAVDGTTLLLARSVDDVKGALDIHAHHLGITAASYDKALAGLPRDTAVAIYGNLAGTLATPSAAKARLIPWIAAIRSYAVTVSTTGAGLTASFRIDTSGSSLTAAQLPLPPGSTAPSVAGQAPVAAGVKQLAHVIGFGEAVAQVVDPARYAKTIKDGAKVGIDLNKDIVSQFTGDAEVDYAQGGVIFRAQIRDPAAAQRTLAKDKKELNLIAGGFYQSRTGRQPTRIGVVGSRLRIGVVGSRLVIGKATPAALRAFADQTASPISGAPGPIAFRLALTPLISLVMAQRSSIAGSGTHYPIAGRWVAGAGKPLSPMIQGLLNMFGDITGYARDDSSSLLGSITVPLK